MPDSRLRPGSRPTSPRADPPRRSTRGRRNSHGRVACAGPDRRPRGHLDGAGETARAAGDHDLARAELRRARPARRCQRQYRADRSCRPPARPGRHQESRSEPPAARPCATSREQSGVRSSPRGSSRSGRPRPPHPRPRRVEASTPEAMSQATTGASQRLIASIAAAAGSRGAPSKPVPKIASTTAPEPTSQESRSSGRSPEKSSSTSTAKPISESRRAATNPSPPLLPFPQTIRTGPSGASPATASAKRSPGRLHQIHLRDTLLLDRPPIDSPDLLGVIQRRLPGLHLNQCRRSRPPPQSPANE